MRTRTSTKDLNQFINRIRADGFQVSEARKHYRVQGNGVLMFMSKTPSDGRALRNIRAELHRRSKGAVR